MGSSYDITDLEEKILQSNVPYSCFSRAQDIESSRIKERVFASIAVPLREWVASFHKEGDLPVLRSYNLTQTLGGLPIKFYNFERKRWVGHVYIPFNESLEAPKADCLYYSGGPLNSPSFSIRNLPSDIDKVLCEFTDFENYRSQQYQEFYRWLDSHLVAVTWRQAIDKFPVLSNLVPAHV